VATIRRRPIAGGQADAGFHAAWCVSLKGSEFGPPNLASSSKARHGGANLPAESGLYRLSYTPRPLIPGPRSPASAQAISALRYMLSRIDARGLRVPEPEDPEKLKPKKRPWLHWTNDALYGPPLRPGDPWWGR